MSDSGIKLFGKTIQFDRKDDVSHAIEAAVVDCDKNSCDHYTNNCLSFSYGSVSPTSLCHKNAASEYGSKDLKNEDGCMSKVLEEQAWLPSKTSREEDEEENETSGPEEKQLKKPDKILPCPRCNSMDTKFCYFNNYTVSQPRHFCKKCQRYWTAGGAMRNVLVGAGRRKNKSTHSSPAPRCIVIPHTSNGVLYPPFRPNINASESPLCESINSTLTIDENPVNHHRGGPYFTAPPWPNPWTTLSYHVPFYAMPTSSCKAPGSWVQPPCASTSSGPCSLLGKCRRERIEPSEGEQQGTETKVLVPKTFRFDDPSEAAKSSIWTTLGIMHENTGSLDSGVFFRGLQSKASLALVSLGSDMSSVLQANPAAMSRSLTYHESLE